MRIAESKTIEDIVSRYTYAHFDEIDHSIIHVDRATNQPSESIRRVKSLIKALENEGYSAKDISDTSGYKVKVSDDGFQLTLI